MPDGNQELAPWRTRDSSEVIKVAPWFHITKEEVELPSGHVIDDFYQIDMPDFATVLASRPDGQFVLVRGYKHGVGQVTLMPPAGMIEPGEAPLAAAQRELLEETGYTSSHWQSLGAFVVDANRGCGQMHLFLARQAEQTTAPRDDETEVLSVELLSLAELREALLAGELKNLAALAAAAMCFVVDR